mgnify:CR=1 FL=1
MNKTPEEEAGRGPEVDDEVRRQIGELDRLKQLRVRLEEDEEDLRASLRETN